MALKLDSSFRSLEISGFDCEGDDEAGLGLAGTLGENSILRTFDARCCAVGGEARRHPRGALGQNSGLRRFEIESGGPECA